ncbi:hypothetical protein [Streptomyces liliifuscus]|uniref:Uncharacterized protein n=1 Tax=Streptomyces liliifuscus TaxID=2797636 RepID=A0A7T7I6K7_9ACTN|nr:hypothetical protein [Streptomyces liliifuscus]QQM41965.1 hypothetical protein JEQ17_22655 [Streptomyces liliifuscus]
MNATPEGTETMNNTTAIAAATAQLVADQAIETPLPRDMAGSPGEPRTRADEPVEDGARGHADVDVKDVTVSIGGAELTGELVIWWPVSRVDHHIEAAYDPAVISLAHAQSRLRTDLAGRGLNVEEFIDEDAKPAVSPEVARALVQMDAQEQTVREAGLWDANYERVNNALREMFIETNSVGPVLEVIFQGEVDRLAAKHGLRLARANESADKDLDGKLLVWREYGLVLLPHGMTARDALDQLRAALAEARAPRLTPAQSSLVLDEDFGGLRSAAPIESTMRDIDDQRTPAENAKTPFLAAEIVQLDWDRLSPVNINGRWQSRSVDGQFTKVWVHYGTNTADVSREKARDIAREMREFADRLDALVDRADEIGSSDFTDEARANKA